MGKRHQLVESAIYISIWLVFLAMPLLWTPADEVPRHFSLQRFWVRLLPWLIVFLVNNFVLLPRLLLRGRIRAYLIWVGVIILSTTALNHVAHLLWDPPLGAHPNPMPTSVILITHALIALLVIGFNTGVKVTSKWMRDAETHQALEKENLETKIAVLRHQISPHFFMNTLNNIHALVDLDPDKAKESCIRLSRMMRYLLYDSERGRTSLAKEVEFMQSYVELMRLRFPENVSIDLDLPKNGFACEIPSLLFVPFVENAFKHGIRPRETCFVQVKMLVQEGSWLDFSVRNSSAHLVSKNADLEKTSGIGLNNVRKRLDLLFGNQHSLQIVDGKNEFSVNLRIPL
ncbi:MAG TPA: histidine kinase [Fibrobacteraceae bacterium]|nr:histidine kinase [Fibrobacteraceae bacterium]